MKALRILAQKSGNDNDNSLSTQITHIIALIELPHSRFKKIEAETSDILKFDDSVIMTIPDIEHINNGMILGEIGDIHRFFSPSRLLTFASLYPSIYSSGNF